MDVRIRISPILRRFIDNRDVVEVEGETVSECLEDLIRQFPGMKKWIYNTRNELEVLVAVNGEVVHQPDLSRKVRVGDLIQISVLIGGG